MSIKLSQILEEVPTKPYANKKVSSTQLQALWTCTTSFIEDTLLSGKVDDLAFNVIDLPNRECLGMDLDSSPS